jgi:hypothetical protein
MVKSAKAHNFDNHELSFTDSLPPPPPRKNRFIH